MSTFLCFHDVLRGGLCPKYRKCPHWVWLNVTWSDAIHDHVSHIRLITSEVSRMKVFHFLNWFWYASDMICCYELFLAWFCSYDVDTVSETILIWFQLWFLMWVKIVVWSQPIGTTFKTVSKPYQDRIKIVSNQNRIKTISKSYQSHKNPREIDQKAVPGLFLLPFLKPTRGEPW